ncbi:hypothetical protein ABIE33_006456 [Ensifer sp. 4252]
MKQNNLHRRPDRLQQSIQDNPYLSSKIAQQAADVVFNGNCLLLRQFASRQQGAALLADQRLHIHRPEQIDAHHLGDATGVVAIALVRLCLEKCLGMASFDAGYR